MERQQEEELEAFRKRIIEEERERLLREHAPRLLGYLPKVKGLCSNLMKHESDKHKFVFIAWV